MSITVPGLAKSANSYWAEVDQNHKDNFESVSSAIIALCGQPKAANLWKIQMSSITLTLLPSAF